MPRLVAHVAGLGAVGTVAGDVAHLVAVVAGLREPPVVRVVRCLGTGARDVSRLVAVVARRGVGTLVAVFGDVALAVAAVAPVSGLLAVASEVTEPVALEALLAAAAEAPVSAAAVSASALRTLACEMTGPVAFVAHA